MLRIIEEAFTFDDVLLLPGYSEVLPKEVSLESMLTKNISLKIPLVSSAMDTVTESSLAIAMAQEGGIGIIHKNMSITQQADEVRKVKKHESGIVNNPIKIDEYSSISELLHVMKKNSISGVPVMSGSNLVGIVTKRDTRFITDLTQPVLTIMTPKDRLVTALKGTTQADVKDLLHVHRIEKILIVDHDFSLCGIITVKDMQKSKDYPLASKDQLEQLQVGAAVGTSPDTNERVAALVDAGIDLVVVDTAHGHSKSVIQQVQKIKKNYPALQVIGGNIATANAAKALMDAGVDAVKVGIGPGSICTTRIVTGIGVPQITAISNVANALFDTGIPVIADGGIRFSGDIAKAIVAGASTVMLGSVLAGTKEAPGEIELYQGRRYKAYRGMGSLGAMSQAMGSSDRYFQDMSGGVEKLVPEGIEGRVLYKGSMVDIVQQMTGGLRSAMGYTGSKNIDIMKTIPEFVRVTNAGMKESHVHDVTITKESPNYRVG